MSIFDSFFPRSTPAPSPAPAAQPTQQQQQQQPTGTPAPPAPAPDPTRPTMQDQFGVTTQEPNPLDAFKDLFTPPKPALNADGTPVAAPPTVAVAFDQTQVSQQLANVDFMKNAASQEDLAAIVAGGEGAAQALAKVINNVGRQALLMSTSFAAKSANSAADFAYNRANSGIPEMVRGQMTQAQFADNPALQHPALVPMVEAMSTQFRTMYPKASPQEIKDHVSKYFAAVGGVFAQKPNAATDTQNTQQQSTDWNNWFTQ